MKVCIILPLISAYPYFSHHEHFTNTRAFAAVLLDGEDVAVKVVPHSASSTMAAAQQEVALARSLHHTHCVRTRDAIVLMAPSDGSSGITVSSFKKSSLGSWETELSNHRAAISTPTCKLAKSCTCIIMGEEVHVVCVVV